MMTPSCLDLSLVMPLLLGSQNSRYSCFAASCREDGPKQVWCFEIKLIGQTIQVWWLVSGPACHRIPYFRDCDRSSPTLCLFCWKSWQAIQVGTEVQTAFSFTGCREQSEKVLLKGLTHPLCSNNSQPCYFVRNLMVDLLPHRASTTRACRTTPIPSFLTVRTLALATQLSSLPLKYCTSVNLAASV